MTRHKQRTWEWISDRIRELRWEKGFSQQDLASAIRVATNTISRWENGSSSPSIEYLLKLAEVFGVHPSSLLPVRPEPSPENRLLEIALVLPQAQQKRLLAEAEALHRQWLHSRKVLHLSQARHA